MPRTFDPLRHIKSLAERIRGTVGRQDLWIPFFIFCRAGAVYLALGAFIIPSLIGHFGPDVLTQVLHTPTYFSRVGFNPLTLELTIHEIQIQSDDHRNLIEVERLGINLDSMAMLWHRAPCFDRIQIVGPALDLRQEKDGGSNLSHWIETVSKASPEEPEGPAKGTLPPLRINHLELMEGRLAIYPSADDPDYSHQIDHIQLQLEDLSTAPKTTGLYRLQARLGVTGNLSWQGEVSLSPLKSEGSLAIELKNSPELERLLAELPGMPSITGDIEVKGSYEVESEPKLRFQVKGVEVLGHHLRAVKPSDRIDQAVLTEARIEGLDLASDTQALRVERLTLGGIQLNLALPSPAQAVNAGPRANPNAKFTENLSEGPNWRAEIRHATVSDLTIVGPPALCPASSQPAADGEASAATPACQIKNNGPSLATRQALIDDLDIDLGMRAIRIRNIALKQPSASVVRGTDGRLFLQSARKESPSGNSTQDANGRDDGARSTAWDFGLEAASVEDGSLHFEQKMRRESLVFDVEHLAARMVPASKGNEIHIEADLKEGGSLLLEASRSQNLAISQAVLKVQNLNLLPLQGLVLDATALRLEEAQLDVNLSLNTKAPFGPLNPEIQGVASLQNVSLLKAPLNQKFFRLKALELIGIHAVPAEKRFHLSELKLLQPDAIVAIRGDKKSNLSDIVEHLHQHAPVAGHKSAPPQAPLSSGTGPVEKPFSLGIDRVAIEKGRVDYSDESLIIPFSSQINQLNGVITGVDFNPESEASLRIFGAVGEYGEASLEGRLRPAAPKAFTDIDLAFRNVQMSTLSPYSATFAGRKIESGKLNVSTHYHSKAGEFKSENKVFLERLRLGDTIESPKSVSLPLDLAVSILSDAQGNIETTLPVQGNLNDPEFDYGRLVLDAISNLLKRAVTAPFTLLSSVFDGTDDQDLGKIRFNPGESRLIPPERERLMKLVGRLNGKKNLSLILHGGSVQEIDAAGLKQRKVRETVAEALGTFTDHVEPDPINVSAAKTQRVLEKLASQLDCTDATVQAFEEQTGHVPDRVTLLTTLMDRPSKTPDFYQALLEAIEKDMPLPEGALVALGDARAQAIARELVDTLHFEPNRLSVGPLTQAVAADNGMVLIGLELKNR